jgi:IclR family pca regulon transcriptional regulator
MPQHAPTGRPAPDPDELRAARPKDLVQSLERGLAVITAFDSEHRSMNLTEIAQRCGLPRSAARRFLHTLADLGYVSAAGRQFSLTPQVLELGYSYLPKVSLAEVVRPHIEELARKLGASVAVAVLDGADIRYVSRVNAPSALAVSIRVGSRVAAHDTALGRVLLAACSQEQFEGYLARSAQATNSHHLGEKDRAELIRALEAVRRQQWSYVDRLASVGVRAVAVLLHNRDGEPVAALSASRHDARLSAREMVQQFVPPLQEYASRISFELRRGIDA